VFSWRLPRKLKFTFRMSSPTISISLGLPTPSPFSWARRMYLRSFIGSKPMSFAATASIATQSLEARM
jgi:hypothetical protein